MDKDAGQGENISSEALKQFYDRYWIARKHLCIDEKCRKNFVISSVEKIKSEDRPMRTLDLGCGRGWLTEILSEYGNVLGIDLSIDAAKMLYPHLKFKQANIAFDKIEGNYDVIISSEVIEHLTSEHQQIYIKKTYELLSENGYLILTTPNKPNTQKLVKELSIKRDQLQPIENWLDEKSLLSLLKPYFKIRFVGSVMFYPIFFRKYRSLSLLYSLFYNKLRGYKFVDRILKSSNRGLYLAIIGQRKC